MYLCTQCYIFQGHLSIGSGEEDFLRFLPYVGIRAREIVGFAGSGPIFETENRFISRQEA